MYRSYQRSRVGADEAAKAAARDPRLFAALIDAMGSTDEMLAGRSAIAAERASAENPALLGPHKNELLGRLAQIERRDIRWPLTQMLPRLKFDSGERERAVALVVGWLEGSDGGAMAGAGGLESLASLADADERRIETVKPVLEQHASSGPPALRARARSVLATLG
jgi:hypothetical protein